MNQARPLLALALCGWLAAPGWPNQAAILQIRIVEGEGAVHAVGSRASRPFIVQVTDETGRPVDGAAVSFRLPDDGPSGVFGSGLRSELALTGADGRAQIRDLRWNRTAGPLQIRVTASKGQARAGTIVSVYISDAPVAASRSRKWIVLGAVGAAAGGVAFGLTRAAGERSSVAEPPRIGVPVITVGAP